MKKGFTLTELLVSIVIITMLLMVVLPTISNIMNKNNEQLYASYEEMTVEYAKISDSKDKNRIELNEISGIEKVQKECTGYVLVDKSSTPYNYKAYLKCGSKYQTAGYIG